MYGSERKPANSEPVDLRITRSLKPPTTHSPSVDTVTAAVRTSWPLRTNVWSCSAPSITARSQAYSSSSMRAASTGPTSCTKWRPNAKPYSSMPVRPWDLAYA